VPSESLFYPRIEKNIAGASVEPCHRPAARQVAEIGYPAQVDDDAVHARAPEDRSVKRGNQGSALAAGGDIGAAEVRDNRDAGALGKSGGTPKLHRIPRLGHVAHGLPMTADRANEPRT
jgi:hypothetical protein